MSQHESATARVYVECDREWTHPAERWQRFRADLEETALYCPECAEREFSDEA